MLPSEMTPMELQRCYSALTPAEDASRKSFLARFFARLTAFVRFRALGIRPEPWKQRGI